MSDGVERFHVVIEPAGLPFDAPADVPLLRAAREAGLVLPSSCRNGTCRVCICQLVSGQVRYTIDWPGLSAEKKAAGFILPCAAHATTALVLRNVKVTGLRSGAAMPSGLHPPR